MRIDIFTDGACLGNPGPGAAACLMRAAGTKGVVERRLVWFEPATTNNRMELLAVILGLEALKEPQQDVRVVTDSQYVTKGYQEYMPAWKRQGWPARIKNPDLWRRLDLVASKHRVRWEWVRGHNGHPENEVCDSLANGAARQGGDAGLVLDEKVVPTA